MSDSRAIDQTQDADGPRETRSGIRRRALFLLPTAAFVLLAGALSIGLTRDPRLLPSTLLDKPVPEFALPPVEGRTLGLATADLTGEVSLVNVWASWCVPCRQENPLLMRLQREGTVPIHGINYKDQPGEAARWLDTYGDPFTRNGADIDGRAGIEWGVYGVPETFVVSAEGRVVHKHIGLLTQKDLDKTILPLIARLRQSRGERP